MKHLSIISGILFLSLNVAMAQQGGSQRIPLIGSKAPAFKAPSTNGPLSFPGDFENRWKILFSHPRDFTPVCSSEILDLAYRQEEFNALGTQIVVISVDKLVSHQSWKADLENINFKGRDKVQIDFPLVVDSTYAISYKYGMVDTQSKRGQSVRGVFFIDPENGDAVFWALAYRSNPALDVVILPHRDRGHGPALERGNGEDASMLIDATLKVGQL